MVRGAAVADPLGRGILSGKTGALVVIMDDRH
jgi:hypothetical protein